MTSHRHGGTPAPDDPRPLGGYAVIMGAYGVLAGSLALGLRRRRRAVRSLSALDLLLLALATQHVSRLLTKDAVTSPVRAPFTEFEEEAGEGEVNEEVVGTGLRHAVGELVTCPFCVAQWVATGFIAGGLIAPELTTAAISVSAAARASDYLQLVNGILRRQQ